VPENFEDEAARIGGPRSAAFTARALPPEVIAADISLDIYICMYMSDSYFSLRNACKET